MSTQKLLWIPKGDGHVPFGGSRPSRVWTISSHKDPASPPSLPFTPAHLYNAFLEDHIHDWKIRMTGFHYYSRVADLSKEGVWLLLEWDE